MAGGTKKPKKRAKHKDPATIAYHEDARRKYAPTIPELKRRRRDGIPEPTRGVRASVTITQGATRVLMGEDSVKDWDDEEILRGRRRGANGRFTGRDPVVVPTEVHNELVRRSMAKSNRKFYEMQSQALDALKDIMTGEDVEDRDRLAAIKIVLDRTMGTAPQRVEVTGTSRPWENLLVDSIVSGGEPEGVLEGEGGESD